MIVTVVGTRGWTVGGGVRTPLRNVTAVAAVWPEGEVMNGRQSQPFLACGRDVVVGLQDVPVRPAI